MNLHPARYPDEPREDYRKRRKAENKAVREHLRGKIASYNFTRPKLGKAATKRAKRARRLAREAA